MQYEDALVSWMLNPDPRISGIVYCDNSTPDLDWTLELVERYGYTGDFEAVYCSDNDIPGRMHYGYAELGIIDYAMGNSRIIQQSRYFAKATGRLKFPRFSDLLDRLPSSFDACIDYRLAYRYQRKTWSKYRARTQLMLFSSKFYNDRLIGKRALMRPNRISHIEEYLAGILAPNNVGSENIVFRWPISCPPSGFGGNGENYDSTKSRVRSFISNVCRQVLPWYWI